MGKGEEIWRRWGQAQAQHTSHYKIKPIHAKKKGMKQRAEIAPLMTQLYVLWY